MAIRYKLLSIFGLLALVALAFAAHQSWRAVLRLDSAETVLRFNEIGDDLHRAATDWAVERGLSNAVVAAGRAASAQADEIRRRRGAGDAAFQAGVGGATSLAGADPRVARAIADARRAGDAADRLRQGVDAVIGGSAPSDALRRDWFSTATGRIMAAQGLRAALDHRLPDGADPLIVDLLGQKAALWRAAEFAGRERGILAGRIAGGEPVSPADAMTVLRAVGEIDAALALLVQRRDAFGPVWAQTVDRIAASQREAMDPLRRTVMAAGLTGQPYPVDAAAWFDAATKAIASLVEAREVASRLVVDTAGATIDAARFDLYANLAILLACAVLVAASVWIVWFDVTAAMTAMARAMARLARSEFEVEIPGRGRRDEIGSMADAVSVFRDNGIEARDLRARQEADRQDAEEKRRASLMAMAETIEREAGEALERVADRNTRLEGLADEMSRSAETVGADAEAVAATSAQVLSNTQAAARAAEDLADSIRAISGQAGHAGSVSRQAEAAGNGVQSEIGSLSEQVARIGEVTTLINAIAAQTNLLALNATIEAARAGEAGKGFAVVASEVKSLATQTSNATEEIGRQIAAIQATTGGAVRSVQEMGERIRDVTEAVTSISASVEEQTSATQEISRSVGETADAARQVTERITQVSAEARGNRDRATAVGGVAEEVIQSIGELRQVVVHAVRTSTGEVDRRRHPRRPASGPVVVEGRHGRSDGRLVDVSEGGMRLGDVTLARGDRVRVSGSRIPGVEMEVVESRDRAAGLAFGSGVDEGTRKRIAQGA